MHGWVSGWVGSCVEILRFTFCWSVFNQGPGFGWEPFLQVYPAEPAEKQARERGAQGRGGVAGLPLQHLPRGGTACLLALLETPRYRKNQPRPRERCLQSWLKGRYTFHSTNYNTWTPFLRPSLRGPQPRFARGSRTSFPGLKRR